MSKKLLHRVLPWALALALAPVPPSAFADMAEGETIDIFAWQDWSYELIEYDKDGGGERSYDRLSSNDSLLGFVSYMDTGIDGLQVGFRCTQFTFWGRFSDSNQWCNHNSKISLRHDTMGEIMFAHWLLPFNEIVAGWVDPFADVGADSHTSIMGNIGGAAYITDGEDSAILAGGTDSSAFYNGGAASPFETDFGAMSFNRRQQGIVQYVWPNTGAVADQTRDGFQFRFAVTEGSPTDEDFGPEEAPATVDPRIISTGVAWQRNFGHGSQIWLAAAYEEHKDVSFTGISHLDDEATSAAAKNCTDSDDDGMRFAGRYSHDWGNGGSTTFAAMWEELDYNAECGEQKALWSDVERDAWMLSGKHAFGNGFDVRFSYMDADEWECGSDLACTAEEEKGTGAEAYNLGLFYTLPAGTELRLTYSEVQNDANAGYDFGINAATGGDARGQDIELWAVGIIHSFD